MKFDWKNWNTGGKTIFAATTASAVSMFMNWTDIGFASQSGFSQQAFLFLVLWIYPVFKLLKNHPISRIGGVTCSIASIALTLAYINSKSVDVFGHSGNVAGTGAWIFMFASIALLIGVLKYSPAEAIE